MELYPWQILTRNFQYVTSWQGLTYFSLGNGIGEIDQNDQFGMVGPLQDTGDINKTGHCVGLSSEKDWLYEAMDEGTNTIIYKTDHIKTKRGLEVCVLIKHIQNLFGVRITF